MDTQKRKKNNYFSNSQKKKKQQYLESGMVGFLCTCNFREKECIKDAYKLFETFSNESSTCQDGPKIEKEDDEVDAEDISDALNKEIKELNDESKKTAVQRKFQYIDTGAKNVIFISTTLPDPLDLAMKIIKDLDETKRRKSRFLLRLIPIQLTCKANIIDIKTKSSDLFEKYFAQEPKTFSIVFNRHYNNSIQRKDVIDTLAALISEKNPGNKANLSNPEIAVVVEIIKGHCLISIAPEYFKYKKYNLLELCNVEVNKSIETVTPEEQKGDLKQTGLEGKSGSEEKEEAVEVKTVETTI